MSITYSFLSCIIYYFGKDARYILTDFMSELYCYIWSYGIRLCNVILDWKDRKTNVSIREEQNIPARECNFVHWTLNRNLHYSGDLKQHASMGRQILKAKCLAREAGIDRKRNGRYGNSEHLAMPVLKEGRFTECGTAVCAAVYAAMFCRICC